VTLAWIGDVAIVAALAGDVAEFTGPTWRSPRGRLTPSHVARVGALLDAGMPQTAVAQAVRADRKTVRRVVRLLVADGVALAPCVCGKPGMHRGACLGETRRRRPSVAVVDGVPLAGLYAQGERLARVVALLREGRSAREVARMTGRHVDTVRKAHRGLVAAGVAPAFCACGRSLPHRGACTERRARAASAAA
jgi:hypothetical protein